MTKKLLHKTSRVYLIFSLVILLVSAPLFYFITKKLYADETNDTLILHKNEFLQYAIPSFKISDIENWNKYNRDIKIKPAETITRDTIFETAYFDTLDNELEPYRELHAPIVVEGKPFTYVARNNMIESKDVVQSTALLFVIVILVLLIGLYFTTNFLSKKLWHPFNDTLTQIEQFEIDKSKAPHFTETDIDEFVRLNKSIENLIEKNSVIYRNQREFIENAAHELQTPLAVFQAKIDTLIQLPDITQAQSEILSSLNDNISKLNHLNKNLLLLSKIENNAYHNKESIIVNDIIQKNLFFFKEQAAARNINIRTSFEQELKIDSNAALVEIMINNLLLNAIRHNIANGEIVIHIANHTLSISNTGQQQGLSADKLFVRFSKTTSEEQGNGLGLAIVKKIIELNNWQIDYALENNLHVFTVTC
ncbi:MAG: HAMP domain-containing sensor histidine kinase [Chitinophagales bacterium]